MKKAELIKKGDSVFLKGIVDFDSVVELQIKGRQLILENNKLSFDFKKVTRSGSAGLALLLDWLSFAKLHHKKFLYVNIPSEMLGVAKACQLDKVLKIDSIKKSR